MDIRMRNQDARSIRTQAQLIEAATRFFADRGYDGTSIRQIARAVDANVAAVSYHFGGKQGLYDAVLGEVHEGMEQAWKQAGLEHFSTVERLVEGVWSFTAEQRDALRICMRRVVAQNHPQAASSPDWLQQRLGSLAEEVSSELGLDLEHTRLSLVTLGHTITRHALNSPEELCEITGLEDPEEARSRTLRYLYALAHQVLTPMTALS